MPAPMPFNSSASHAKAKRSCLRMNEQMAKILPTNHPGTLTIARHVRTRIQLVGMGVPTGYCCLIYESKRRRIIKHGSAASEITKEMKGVVQKRGRFAGGARKLSSV